MVNRSLAVKKVKSYVANPDLIKEPTMGEMADLVVLVLSAVQQIETAIKEGRLDGKTPEPDKDYLSYQATQKMLTDGISRIVNEADNVLAQTSKEIQRQVETAIENIRNGEDGVVTDEEIQRAASVALGMLDLPDFDKLVTEQITTNGEAIRDALELLSGDARYKVEIDDVQGLKEIIEQLSLIRGSGQAGGISKNAVLKLIAENGGGGITDGDKGDITVSGGGTVWSIDADTIGQSELATTGTPDGTKFLRDDMSWTAIPGGGDALTANPLSQFASTTSLQLKNTISDETGSGALVFATSPTLVTPVLGAATATSINGATITSGTLNGTVTGTNTGDQTSIVGITGTKAQFDTAVTDGNFLYVGDVTQYTDELAQDAVGAMVDSTIVYNDATPALSRAALTGAITASAGSNTTALGSFTKAQLDTAVSDGNVLYVGDVTSNATHTGEVTGSGALTVDKTAITNKTLVTAAVGDHILVADASDSDNLKKVTVQTIVDLAGGGTFSGCRVYQSAGQSIGTTLTAATFDTESFDTDTMHDNATNNTRITFTTAGKYAVSGIINTDANAASWAGIRLNGSTYIATNGSGNAGASTANGTNVETIYDFAASDYVELMGAFGTTQTTKSGIGGTHFSAYKIN